MKSKTLTHLLMIILLLSTCVFGEDKARAKRIKIRQEFNTAKERALQIIEWHSESHTDCQLLKVVPTIRRMTFWIAYEDRYFGAWIYDKRETYDDEHPAHVFVNANYPWDSFFQILTVIHEAFHLTYNESDKKYICGPDRIKAFLPVCTLFKKSMYVSADITIALREHLKPYEKWKFDK